MALAGARTRVTTDTSGLGFGRRSFGNSTRSTSSDSVAAMSDDEAMTVTAAAAVVGGGTVAIPPPAPEASSANHPVSTATPPTGAIPYGRASATDTLGRRPDTRAHTSSTGRTR